MKMFLQMKKFFFLSMLAVLLLSLLNAEAQENRRIVSDKAPGEKNCVPAPAPFGPVPTPAQVEWQRMEMNMFCHFGPNTFTGKEWGEGTEIEDVFNPTQLNCHQWVDIAKNAGFKGVIITAKHHDGFCLWPNPVSNHTVKQSSWRKGKGDVLKDLSEACRQKGMKFGIYISPWDRNAPAYGTPAYNKVFLATLKNALSKYGPVFEQWFDGACGEGPNGRRQEYDWPAFNAQVYKLQPAAMIFSDVGPGCRWVGNEQGRAGQTCWSRLDTDGFAPGADAPSQDTLTTGNYNGKYWIPVETDVSIRPGWFYRSTEHPKTLQELLSIYYTSVGRNSLLLLNVPPDERGLIAAEDSARLMEFRAAIDKIFSHNLADNAEYIIASNVRGTEARQYGYWRSVRNSYLPVHDYYSVNNLLDAAYCDWSKEVESLYVIELDPYYAYWATDDSVTTAWVKLIFDTVQTFNRVLLQEYIPLGQRVEKFHIDFMNENGDWETIAEETTIGYKRIVLLPTCTAKQVRVTIDNARACPVLNRLGLFYDDIYQIK